MELQNRYSDLQARGIGLAVVTYDSTDTLKRFADARGIEVSLLSDSGSETTKRYDLLNREMDPTTRFAGDPCPGTFKRPRTGTHLPASVSGAVHGGDNRCASGGSDRRHGP